MESNALKKLEEYGKSELLNEVKKHQLCQGIEDPGRVAEYIGRKYLWAFDEELNTFCFHNLNGTPSAVTVSAAIMVAFDADTERHLFAVKAWQPPKFNPWVPEHFNLTVQGEVFKNDPALVKRWQHEADVLKAQRAGRK